jgi:transposase
VTQQETRAVIAQIRTALLRRDQKMVLACVLRKHGWTLERIARALGVSVGTAHRWTANVQLFDLEKFIGADGKARPPKYKPRMSRRVTVSVVTR